MPKYLLIYKVADDDNAYAKFLDDYDELVNMRLNIECGLGGYTEVYFRCVMNTEDGVGTSEYQFVM